VTGFNGKAFLLGIQHLDAASRELFDRYGRSHDGRRALVEALVDDATLRLAGDDVSLDPDGSDRTA
jgi:hypothetical protein